MSTRAFSKLAAGGFTLVEMMITTGVSAALFAALMYSGVMLQRSFMAADQYSRAINDQMRATDYITRDIRNALTITVSADAQTLTVTLPDSYNTYDAQGNPTGDPWNAADTNRKDPAVTGTTVDYGDTTKPITVSYYVSNQQIVRQQWWWVSGVQKTSSSIVASNVSNFQFSFVDMNSVVNATITFTPQFHTVFTSAGRAATQILSSTSIRNSRRN